MAKDWVERHLQELNTEQQLAQREHAKLQHALAGAERVFQRLSEQVQEDVAAFCRGIGNDFLQYYKLTEKKFRVRRPQYPSVTLEVELISTTIAYERSERFDDTQSRYHVEKGELRIWSDLAGNVQVYKNGTPFLDESEVSQHLLMPAFTYIEPK